MSTEEKLKILRAYHCDRKPLETHLSERIKIINALLEEKSRANADLNKPVI